MVAALCGGLLSVPPASAAGQLVIAGNRTAAVDVVLGEVTTYRQFAEGGARRFFGVPSGGTFGGFLVESLPSRRIVGGGVYRRDVTYHRDRRPLPSRFGPDTVTLQPGRYRFHLLTDAPIEIRLPLVRGASRRLEPSGASGMTVLTRRLAGDATGTAAALDLAVQVAEGQQVSFFTYSRIFGKGYRELAACLKPAVRCDRMYPWAIHTGELDSPSAWMAGLNYDRHSPLRAGRHVLRFEAVHRARVEATYALVLLFPRGAHFS